ncbi:OmpA family protein [Endothiovibrio diazotrophicus]
MHNTQSPAHQPKSDASRRAIPLTLAITIGTAFYVADALGGNVSVMDFNAEESATLTSHGIVDALVGNREDTQERDDAPRFRSFQPQDGNSRSLKLNRPKSSPKKVEVSFDKEYEKLISALPPGDGGCQARVPGLAVQIEFDSGSYSISPSGYRLIGEIAQAMKSPGLAGCRFTVEGHTDAAGGTEFNRQLSEKRARSVGNYLIYGGIDPQRMVIYGWGESQPINQQNPYSDENRRVQFVILK